MNKPSDAIFSVWAPSSAIETEATISLLWYRTQTFTRETAHTPRVRVCVYDDVQHVQYMYRNVNDVFGFQHRLYVRVYVCSVPLVSLLMKHSSAYSYLRVKNLTLTSLGSVQTFSFFFYFSSFWFSLIRWIVCALLVFSSSSLQSFLFQTNTGF